MNSCLGLVFLLASFTVVSAQTADWPEPRHDRHLTAIQPVMGGIKHAPVVIGEIDLGRVGPLAMGIEGGAKKGKIWIAIIGGELRGYAADGKIAWTCHPPGINFTSISATGDFDGDGESEIALQAGRSAAPFGAAVLVSAADGRVIWRYDVEPMSYAWYLHVLDEKTAPGAPAARKEILIVMQGYPPDAKNGYSVMFHHTPSGWQQKWRYDFSAYTCFPNVLESDLDGDGTKELAVISHSRMWVLDRNDGAVKQFIQWDTSPANVRSYGLNHFVDLNKDGRPDFLCIGNFAKHYEVLLNDTGKLKQAWHNGWADSVTTGKVAVSWPLPAYGDVDGDGNAEIVVSVFEGDSEGKWAIRVHDAISGELKFKLPGMIAARVVDVDGKGPCAILADRSDDASDIKPDGGYAIQHVKGAALLKVRDGKLAPVWQDDHGKAIREENGPPRVQVDQAIFALTADATGMVVQTPWTPPPGKPSSAPALPADTSAGPTPEMLAVDVMGDGSNQIILYREGKVTIWRRIHEQYEQCGQYASSCLPVVADLDGDGRRELVLADVSEAHAPRFKAITPSLANKVLWDVELPAAAHGGLPAPRIAYLRTGKFTGGKFDDLYAWIGTPVVRSLVLDGRTGKIVWEKNKVPDDERYAGPSVNLASVEDVNRDGKEDLVFTNPDMYCVASGATGDFLLGPLTQMKIFSQFSQGLYTMPPILGEGPAATVCLTGGHYFRAAMSLDAKPKWFALPVAGEARCANEGFLQLPDSKWLMAFGRQNGKFACYNVADGSQRWELDVQASCSDVCGCDIDGDGNMEFIFSTSHGALYAVGDDAGKPRILWKLETGIALGPPLLADMDGDGKTDIVVAGEDGRVRVFGTAR
jgi:hypothetical protein